ncbi:MAG: GIY-YIG nuclease family protein, partial [Bacillales bacterium]|nr:GIY-YIG nuclease family protein [Bacillales bacterium]
MNEVIRQKIDSLPIQPGVYLMKDVKQQVIYVGKAKSLNKRIPQYFLKVHEGKTQKMVNSVSDFDIIITNTEKEALILEFNLIKKYYPKFNISLKDTNSYPYITITNDKDPHLSIERVNKKSKNKKYYGPYPN